MEDIVFSAGGGFLAGAVAGYAIRKLIKLAAIIVGLFVVALSYLSYRGWLDVKWLTTTSSCINRAFEGSYFGKSQIPTPFRVPIFSYYYKSY